MLEGKRSIVTGAGSGMGRAAAVRFAAEGARVGLIDLDEAAAASVAAEIEAAGGEALVLQADVRSEADVAAAVGRAAAAWDGLDAIVANAGVQLAGQDDRADRLALEVWQRTIDINLTGVFLTGDAVLAGGRAGADDGAAAAREQHPDPVLGSCASWRPTTRRRASA